MARIAETAVDGVKNLCVSSRELENLFTRRIKDGDFGSKPACNIVLVETFRDLGHTCTNDVGNGVCPFIDSNVDASLLNVLVFKSTAFLEKI